MNTIDPSINAQNLLRIIIEIPVSRLISHDELGGHNIQYLESHIRRAFLNYRSLNAAETQHLRNLMLNLYAAGNIRMTNHSNRKIHYGKRFEATAQGNANVQPIPAIPAAVQDGSDDGEDESDEVSIGAPQDGSDDGEDESDEVSFGVPQDGSDDDDILICEGASEDDG